MRRGGGGGGGSRRLPKSSLAPSTASEATPVIDPVIRNLTNAFNRRDSDAASHCSSRPPSSHGVGISSSHHDRSTQATALRDVNAFLGPAITLRPPLPAARDILNAFRYLLNHLGFHLQEKESTLEDDILLFLRMMNCPHKLARSALKAPGTPHFWPPLLSVLHWLTLLATTCGDDTDSSSFCDLMLYTTKGYSHFIMGDDEAAEALDDEYVNKARTHAEAAVEATRALEKEAEEWEEKRNQLTSGPSRLEALEADKAALAEDVHKFESVVKTWSAKVTEKEEALMNLRKEEEVKLMDAQHLAAENQELLKKVEAQAVNVRDVDRMHRDKQVVENDISKLENGNATLDDQGWELEAALITKLEELETVAEQCNQALKKLKPTIDFQYSINSKGSSPAELLGLSYKTKLKPAFKVYAEEHKRMSNSKLEESIDLQKQSQENIKILEEKEFLISSLQDKTNEKERNMNILDQEIENDDTRFLADAREIKDELERKEHALSSVEQEAADFLKNAEQRLQDTLLRTDEETQACAHELSGLMESVAEHREFMEASIAQRKKDLNETADYIASLASKMS